MIVCPNCQHKEMTGAVFCSQCGAQLAFPMVIKTHRIDASETQQSNQETAPLPTPQRVTFNTWISLFLVDSGQILPLADRIEFTLGRLSEGQPIIPDVDLSPYNAFANGVSRLHAVIKLIKKKAVIADMGSLNGTFLNGERLPANQDHPLKSGDIIALGKMKIQVLITQNAGQSEENE